MRLATSRAFPTAARQVCASRAPSLALRPSRPRDVEALHARYPDRPPTQSSNHNNAGVMRPGGLSRRGVRHRGIAEEHAGGYAPRAFCGSRAGARLATRYPRSWRWPSPRFGSILAPGSELDAAARRPGRLATIPHPPHTAPGRPFLFGPRPQHVRSFLVGPWFVRDGGSRDRGGPVRRREGPRPPWGAVAALA